MLSAFFLITPNILNATIQWLLWPKQPPTVTGSILLESGVYQSEMEITHSFFVAFTKTYWIYIRILIIFWEEWDPAIMAELEICSGKLRLCTIKPQYQMLCWNAELDLLELFQVMEATYASSVEFRWLICMLFSTGLLNLHKHNLSYVLK